MCLENDEKIALRFLGVHWLAFQLYVGFYNSILNGQYNWEDLKGIVLGRGGGGFIQRNPPVHFVLAPIGGNFQAR